MVAAGANGDTADEMKNVLHLSGDIGSEFEKTMLALQHSASFEKDFQLNIVQGAWIKDDFPMLPAFSTLLRHSFQAIAERVPFNQQTVDQINDWVAESTHQKIQNLLSDSEFDESTRLVLANAVYFHGNWKTPFSKKDTSPRPFYLSSGDMIHSETMLQTGRFDYYENEDLKAVALPYIQNHDSTCTPICLIVLSKSKEILDLEKIKNAISSLQPAMVQIQVPKFTLEERIELKPLLNQLGIQKAFSQDEADFSGINGLGGLYLSAVLHKSFFAFDELGVEAAAATAAIINATTAVSKPVRVFPFIADRPFYFFLLDQKTETMLFMGHIENPNI